MIGRKHHFRVDEEAHFWESSFGLWELRVLVYCRGCMTGFKALLGTGSFEGIVLSPGKRASALRNFSTTAFGICKEADAAIADKCAEGEHDFKRVRVPDSVGALGTMYLCLKCLKVEFVPRGCL